MIRHLTHKLIDKKKWDDAITHSFNGLPYAFSWYLDAVCPGWEALVEDDYKKLMPLTCGRKYGIAYLYPPFFTQQLGVFSPGPLSAHDIAEFLSYIPDKYRYIEINLNAHNPYAGNDFSLKENLNHELVLGKPYESLFKNYAENTQRNIAKARRQGLSIRRDAEVNDIIRLFRQNKGKEVKSLKEKHYRLLRNLCARAFSAGHAETRGVIEKGGSCCAGAVFIKTGNRAVFIFSGSDEKAKSNRAMFFLVDEYIREHAGSGMILDFEGSNDPHLARFYKGFGSKESVYLQVRKNKLPGPLKWLKK